MNERYTLEQKLDALIAHLGVKAGASQPIPMDDCLVPFSTCLPVWVVNKINSEAEQISSTPAQVVRRIIVNYYAK